jgi:hypothetical protein
VIAVAAVLLFVAIGLLAGGLAQGSAALQWASFGASALAALVLGLGELRRRRAADREGSPESASVPAPGSASARVVAPGTSAPAGTPPTAPPPTAPPPTAPPTTAPATPPTTPAPPTASSRAPVAAEPVRPASTSPAEAEAPSTGAHAAPPPVGPTTGAHAAPPVTGPSTGAHSRAPVLGPDGEPRVEEVEVTDLLLVLDLTDEVLVVDEHPRYHLVGCPHLSGVDPIPVPMDEARIDGFTPCGTCAPDRNLAERERARRTGR